MREKFVDWQPQSATMQIVLQAGAIIEEMQEQGFTLTVRQLFYQFVARDLIQNNFQSYKRIASIVSDARLGGFIDWDAIEDRTRFVRVLPFWDSPRAILESSANQYREDLWKTQPLRVEVWIEKDALVGVVEASCEHWRVPLFSSRGYPSQSAVYEAAQRHAGYGVPTIVLHLSDHDPSGLNMAEDIANRFVVFGSDTTLRRIALTREQVDAVGAPPNFAKVSDSRASAYVARFGSESWELDAMPPQALSELVAEEIAARIIQTRWTDAENAEDWNRCKLLDFCDELEEDN